MNKQIYGFQARRFLFLNHSWHSKEYAHSYDGNVEYRQAPTRMPTEEIMYYAPLRNQF
jgi:hypothetical protein